MPLIVAQQIFPDFAPDDVITAAPEDLVEEDGNLRDDTVVVDVKLPVQLAERWLPGALLVAVHYAGLAPEKMIMITNPCTGLQGIFTC